MLIPHHAHFDIPLPDMDIFINTDKCPASVQSKSTGSPLTALRVKRGAVVPLAITVLGSQSASNLRMGIKAKGNYEGELLILAEADSGTQTELGTRFDLKLIASSLALNDALDVGEGSSSPPATLAAMTEFAWLEDGETHLSDTLLTTIINDIIRLATDAPEAAAGEYPAPDLVATKSWVNSKQATADAAGFVMLGTDELISGKNARPVGKTSSGGLAVDVSGMSAYDVAVANGFVGTEVAWLASLKGERGAKGEQGEQGIPGIQGAQGEQGIPGASAYQMAVANGYEGSEVEWLSTLGIEVLYEKRTIAPATGEESDYDAYGFGLIMVESGLMQSLTAECRANSANVGTEPVWCKIWKGDQLVALSRNSQVHGAGKSLTWEFEPFVVESGAEYKFLFYKSGTKDLTHFSTDFQGCFRVVRKNPSDGIGMIGAAGGYATSGATEWQPVYKIVLMNPRYTPAAHSSDITLHLTAEEHAGLTQLLANKDALLALINH